jgi:hypothetical protein
MDSTYERLKVVLDANCDALLSREEVTAVAIGYKYVGGVRTDQLAIVLSVRKKITGKFGPKSCAITL